jgi:hypothetical protein
MICRITNLLDGQVSINELRVSLAKGESKDVDLARKINFTAVDGSDELASLISAGSISVVFLNEVMTGYNSGWTSIDQGATVTFTHNLNVDPTRQFVDVLYKDSTDIVSMLNIGLDNNGVTEDGYAVTSISATDLTVYRGVDDQTGAATVCVRVNVSGG